MFIIVLLKFWTSQDVIEPPSFLLCDLAGSLVKKTNSYKHQEDLNSMELQKCCVCKMSKEDVKLRVTGDWRCDLCISKATKQLNTARANPTKEDSEVGATGHDDSRTICLLYENLLEKIVVN